MKVAQMNVGQQMPVEERRNSASVENPHYIPFELLCMSKAVEQLPVPPVVVQVKNLEHVIYHIYCLRLGDKLVGCAVCSVNT